MTTKPASAERQAKGKADAAPERARDAGPGGPSSAALGEALPGWTPADPIHRLGVPQVAALQRSAGNRAVATLLTPEPAVVQRAPGGAAPAKGAPAKAAPKLAAFNSYADLFNGFQDLAAALINRGGAGLDSVHFGTDLTPAHRSLLWSVRTVLIAAQDKDPASRQKAVATWPGVSGRLLNALADARKAGVPGEVVAAVNDQIAMLNKRLGKARGRSDVPEAESGEDYVDTIKAIDQLFIENAGLIEAGPSFVREETPGRPDIEVSPGIVELNAKRRGLINGVKVGGHASSRHAQLVERLRQTLILVRSEKAGSAYAAVRRWKSIEGELRYVLQRGAQYVDGDLTEAYQRLAQTSDIVNNHYSAVHTGNLQAVLSKQRDKGEVKERKDFARKWGPGMEAVVAEKLAVEDVESAFDIIQNHLVKSDREGEWNISNGGTTMRIREDQAANLHALAQQALRGYIQSLVTALVGAREDYDSIKLGNSRTKLRILGFIGGADDPGSFDKETAALIEKRDKVVKPMIDRGDYVGAFKLIMDEKPQVEKRVKEEADYDADLDRGYKRLAVTMSVVQVALVSLVPIAGEAALASAPLWAVGLTATAAGGGGAFVAESGRQLAFEDHYDVGKALNAGKQGALIGSNAVTGAAAKQFGNFMSGGAGGLTATGFEATASGVMGGMQNVAQGGSFGEGFAGNFLGTMGSEFTGLLPGKLQTGVPGTIVQVGVGAGIGKVTNDDPLGGAVGALVPSMVSKGPRPAGGHEEKAASPPTSKEPAGGAAPAPASGETSLPLPGLGGGGPAPAGLENAGTGTTPGTFPPRAPAPPAADVAAGPSVVDASAATADSVSGSPVPADASPGAGSSAPGTGGAKAADISAATADSASPRPVPADAPHGGGSADAVAGGATEKGVPPGPGGTKAPAPAMGADSTAPAPAPDAAGAPAGGSAATAPLPKDAAGAPGGAIRPPTPGQVPPPEAKKPYRDLVESSKVPATGLDKSDKPVYSLQDLINRGHEAKQRREQGLEPRDAKLDMPPDGRVPSTTPTAAYPAEEPTRYKLTEEKPVGGIGSDEAYVVFDEVEKKKFMFKPEEAEYPVDRAEERGIRAGEQAPRDVAAPMVAKRLGLDAPTGRLATIRHPDGHLQRGVLIEWRESNSLKDLLLQDHKAFDRLVQSEQFREAMMSVDAMDYLINNLDRGTNFGNYLYEFTPEGLKLMPIDHGLSFTSTKGRASIGDWTRDLPEHYPKALAEKLENLSRDRTAFAAEIREFVGDAAVEGFLHRLDIMIADMHKKQGTPTP